MMANASIFLNRDRSARPPEVLAVRPQMVEHEGEQEEDAVSLLRMQRPKASAER